MSNLLHRAGFALDHRWAPGHMSDYVDGELAPRGSVRMDRHIAQCEVLRNKSTERPFTGQYVNDKRDGTYRCAGCGAELFSSQTKFDSGTGWPSFTEPADRANVELHDDNTYGMRRVEVTCAACG